MGQIDPTTWSAIFAAAIISIGFSLFATFIVQTWLQIECLSLELGKITKQEALDRFTNIFKVASVIFVVLIIVISVSYVFTFYVNSPPSVVANMTNNYENCTYPVSNVINNYNVTIVTDRERDGSLAFSVEEMKYLVQKKDDKM